MQWFLAALVAPLLWSLVNHADKFILSRYFKGGGSGGLMVFAAVVTLPLAAILAFINPSVLSTNPTTAVFLIVSGAFYNLGVYLYLLALEKADASYVVPFWQLIPVFAYGFGILVLGEHLSAAKLGGGGIVLLGALILSLELGKARKFSLNLRTAGIMLASSAVMALGYVLFKDADAATSGFWESIFWNQAGMFLFGFTFFLIPPFRREFLGVIRKNSKGVLSLNLAEQAVEIAGLIGNNFAILLAPAAMVILVEYTAQPLFVFAFGVLFTLLFPTIVREDLSRRVLAQKLVAILVMGAGLLLVV